MLLVLLGVHPGCAVLDATPIHSMDRGMHPAAIRMTPTARVSTHQLTTRGTGSRWYVDVAHDAVVHQAT